MSINKSRSIYKGGSRSISEIIRKRIVEDGKSFYANYNIAKYIRDGELDLLKREVAENVEKLLRSLVIDVQTDHNTKETASRIAKKYIEEIFCGRYTPTPSITEFPNFKELKELYTLGPISIRSTCSHHFAPVLGNVWIGVIPRDKIIGLSKIHRLVNWIMSRPQIQEEAVVQIADYIEEVIQPKGLAIFIKAKHFCMVWRGVKDNDTVMSNLVLRGDLKENISLQQAFLNIINLSVSSSL